MEAGSSISIALHWHKIIYAAPKQEGDFPEKEKQNISQASTAHLQFMSHWCKIGENALLITKNFAKMITLDHISEVEKAKFSLR